MRDSSQQTKSHPMEANKAHVNYETLSITSVVESQTFWPGWKPQSPTEALKMTPLRYSNDNDLWGKSHDHASFCTCWINFPDHVRVPIDANGTSMLKITILEGTWSAGNLQVEDCYEQIQLMIQVGLQPEIIGFQVLCHRRPVVFHTDSQFLYYFRNSQAN